MRCLVVDIGGTNLRLGLYENGQLQQVKRSKVLSFQTCELKGQDLYQAFMSSLHQALAELFELYPGLPLAISFPGPISAQGFVYGASTLWGQEVTQVNFLQDCQQRFKRELVVMNDISAAAWRYARQEQENFGLFTVSSGIGNKVMYNRSILLNEQGLGGELGHCQVAFPPYDLLCDCGGRGHLGAISSGRGIVQLAKLEASRNPPDFAASLLAVLCQDKADNINTSHLVTAVEREDEFAIAVLQLSQSYLLQAMRHLYHSIGLKRFIFIGGFACALGQHYLRHLNLQLSREDWYGLSATDMQQMCSMGELDDDHSLLGLGYYMQEFYHG